MAKKYLSLERLTEYDALLKAKISDSDASTLESAKGYADEKLATLTSGTTTVAKAESATHATSADTATNAVNAGHATSADTATNAGHATSADTATNATNAVNAEKAAEATHAVNSDTATNANHATTADTATNATNATNAVNATKATQDASGNVITDTYETKSDASSKLEEAKGYADTAASNAANAVKDDLLNGAGEAYDTLKELGDLIDENQDAISALETVATGKADKEHEHTVADITDYVAPVQSDWNQNDETALDYIKNRPFYSGDPVENVLFEETTLEVPNYEDGLYFGMLPNLLKIEENKEYIVTFNGETYNCVGWYFSEYNSYLIGNNELVGVEGPGNNEPFVVYTLTAYNITQIATAGSEPVTLKISCMESGNKTIDTEFLPKHLQFGEGDPVETVLLDGFVLEADEDGWYQSYIDYVELIEGQIYTANINGETCEGIAVYSAQYNEYGIEFYNEKYAIFLYSSPDYNESFIGLIYGEDGPFTISVNATITEVTKIDEKYLPDSAFVQSDWDQGDPYSPDYIKNRPFGRYLDYAGAVEGLSFEGTVYFGTKPDYQHELVSKCLYDVFLDGTWYEGIECQSDGSLEIRDEDGNFVLFVGISDKHNEIYIETASEGEHELMIWGDVYLHEPINVGYIPVEAQSDWNQSNQDNISYIKNKPFGAEYVDEVLFDDVLNPDHVEYIAGAKNYVAYSLQMPEDLYIKHVDFTRNDKSVYTVVINGVKYENLIPTIYNCYDGYMGYYVNYAIGARYDYLDYTVNFTEEYPFCIDFNGYNRSIILYIPREQVDDIFEVSVSVRGGVVNKLPEIYQHKSDWNEIVDTKASFIENKPFGEYLEYELVPIMEQIPLEKEADLRVYDDGQFIYYDMDLYNDHIIPGSKYTVIINNVRYDGVEAILQGDSIIIGEPRYNVTDASSEYPFSIHDRGWDGIRLYIDGSRVPITEGSKFYLYEYVSETKFKTLDAKYLPEQFQFGHVEEKQYSTVLDTRFTFSGSNNGIESENFLEVGTRYIININGNVSEAIGRVYYESVAVLGDNFRIEYNSNDPNYIVCILNPEVYPANTVIYLKIKKEEIVEVDKTIDPKYLGFENIYTSVEVIYPETTHQTTGNSTSSSAFTLNNPIAINQENVGETYIVAFNGIEYKCKCWEVDGIVHLGNPERMLSDDYPNKPDDDCYNNEPFAIICETYRVFCFEPGQYTIGIVKPISSEIMAPVAKRAIQDFDGNVIVDTYETKEDAESKLAEAKEYADSLVADMEVGEHTHSWNDLEDRPFGTTIYTNDNPGVICDSTYELDDWGYCYGICVPSEDFGMIKVGEMYDVVLDDITYTNITCYDDLGYPTIGMSSDFTINSDIPFSLLYDEEFNEFGISVTNEYINNTGDNVVQFKVSEYSSIEIVDTIETKYLPEHLQFGEGEPIERVIIDDVVTEVGEYGYSETYLDYIPLEVGKTYTVTVDGITNDYTSWYESEYGSICIGNFEDSFIIDSNKAYEATYIGFPDDITHTISVSVVDAEIIPLETKYLPEHLQFGEEYTSESYIEVLPRTGLNPPRTGYQTINTRFEIVPRRKYIVIYDSRKYECIAWYHPDWNCGVIGNHSVYNYDSGEPFAVVSMPDEQNIRFYKTVGWGNSYPSIAIYEASANGKPLDPKYLPFETYESREIIWVGYPQETNNYNEIGVGNTDTTVFIDEYYTVTFDGVEYKCKCYSPNGYRHLGNPHLIYTLDSYISEIPDDVANNNEPFVIVCDVGNVICAESGTHTISITGPSYTSKCTVALAQKAVQDSEGRIIAATYATIDNINYMWSSLNDEIEDAKSAVQNGTVANAEKLGGHAPGYYASVDSIPTGSLANKDVVSESDLDSALAEKVNAASEGNHSHLNKDVIDGITSDKVSAWDSAEQNAKDYADGIKNDLLNGAGEAYDTLKELGDLIDDNQDAIKALETVATGKADKEHSHAISEVTGLQDALNVKAAQSDLTSHTGDTTIHITADERTKWNAVTTKAAASDLTSHTGDTTVHITADERTKWNAVTSKVDQTDFANHTGDTTAHITADERTTWNTVTSKANQSDLTSHANNTTAHITADERTKWDTASTTANTANATANDAKAASETNTAAITAHTASINAHTTAIGNLQTAIAEFEEVTSEEIAALFA